jgi:hypothetical protein
MCLAGGKLASRDATSSSRPGHSWGVTGDWAGGDGSSGAPLLAAAAVRGEVAPGRLFFLRDTASGLQFLIDTGSSYSILPHTSRQRQHGPALKAADGWRIRCWGSKQAALQLSGVSYSWKFRLADVKFPILGIHFLRHHKLLVDVVGAQLSPRQPSVAAAAGTESPAAV